MATGKPRLDRAIALRKRKPFQQFGQTNDVSTFNGSTGCTHTCLQDLAYLWKAKLYTHDQISGMVGYPSPAHNAGRRGLRPSEVETFCRKVGLPYRVVWGMNPSDLLSKSNLGPVMFGHSYGWTPEWYGFRYSGITADGRPNGYARPLRAAGKTQLTGFERGAHASLLLGYASLPSWQAFVHEPNHGSPSRPEKPAYDVYSRTQFNNMYLSYQKVLGRTLYALVPTRGL